MVASLALSGISKSFDGFQALDGANFTASAGEVHALLGENGAGKSSIMNVAAGLYAADTGRIEVEGNEVHLSGPGDAKALGIGMVHQHFKLVKQFTVAENVLLANPNGSFASGLRSIKTEIARQAGELGFALDADRPVGTLSIAEQQRVEIIKVLVAGARILILDEPTAVLTDGEADRLLMTIRALARNGATIVLVTHKIAEVMKFADRVTVMRGGKTVATAEPRTTNADALTELVVGAAPMLEARASVAKGKRRLSVVGLKAARSDGHVMLADANFHVCAHEIYGIAGVGGNGQSELAEALMGVTRPLDGAIILDQEGEDATNAAPERRRELGIASIPADRHTYGLAGSLSIAENFAVGQIHGGRYGSWALVDRGAMRTDTVSAIADFEVLGVRGLNQKAALLSGGNAQKLVLAREFRRDPTIIVAHSPSRGLDMRASAAVHQRLLAARDAGAAVLLISEDLDEILKLSDRAGVMVRGRIVAEFEAPFERQAVGRAMVDHA